MNENSQQVQYNEMVNTVKSEEVKILLKII